MKNLIYTFAAVILVTFAACDKNDKNTNDLNANETENVYSDEEIFANVKFVGQGRLSDTEKAMFRASAATNDVTVLHGDLGRRIKENGVKGKGSKCNDKFGICHAYILGWQAWNEIPYDFVDDRSVFIPIDAKSTLSEINFYLADAPGIDMTNVLFPVDEDFELTVELGNGEIKSAGTVKAQKAVFNEELGEFGGYSLSVE